jgi:hypothetical protein
MTAIRHVRSHVSAYRGIPTGQYTVAMRDSGAPATTPPMLSASVQVAPGMAYTIVSMGAPSHLGVQVLKESMTSSPGKALVRIVQESVAQHRVTVNADGRALGGPLQLGSYTGFLALTPGRQAIHATGYSATATRHLLLRANTIHTLVVLDNQGGLRHSLRDAWAARAMPIGGAATGLGHAQSRVLSGPMLATAIAAGCLSWGDRPRRIAAGGQPPPADDGVCTPLSLPPPRRTAPARATSSAPARAEPWRRRVRPRAGIFTGARVMNASRT